MIDSTGSVSMIHLTSTYTDISGWIDLANLEEYIPDYEDSGLEGIADTDKMDAYHPTHAYRIYGYSYMEYDLAINCKNSLDKSLYHIYNIITKTEKETKD